MLTLFQSTLPVKGATGTGSNAPSVLDISIHAPREGSDVSRKTLSAWRRISIHAPREGSDKRIHIIIIRPLLFQSTLPVKGATQNIFPVLRSIIISIHAPREGSDRSNPGRLSCPAISIHAPREGSDSRSVSFTDKEELFQSTLPVKGATAAGWPSRIGRNNFNPRSP